MTSKQSLEKMLVLCEMGIGGTSEVDATFSQHVFIIIAGPAIIMLTRMGDGEQLPYSISLHSSASFQCNVRLQVQQIHV
jgi:hypothetical protein